MNRSDLSDSRPIRILYMIDEIPAVHAGGTERQVLQMIALVRSAGLEPELCVLRGSDWLTEAEVGCPVYHAGIDRILSWRGLKASFRLAAWIRERRFDIVQTFFMEANLLGPVMARMTGVPVILGSRRNMNYWLGRGLAWLQRMSNMFATRLVANCEAVKRAIVQTEEAEASKVDVLHNGVDVERFTPQAEQRKVIRDRLGLSESDVLIGNTSNLFPVKGVTTFVNAAVLVSQNSPRARFLLLGDGPLRSWVEETIAQHSLAERFLLLGSQEDVVPYLHACDIAVLSSDSEGFSNSLLEYMAAGLACVATDVGGNREVLGESGVLVPPGNPANLAAALLRLTDAPEERRKLAEAARSRVERLFSLPQAQERLVEYYQNLLRR